jgi:isoleucyl-tRNA synthetase
MSNTKLSSDVPYPDVCNTPDYNSVELNILKYWEVNETFKKSLTDGIKGDFVFYEGPPFANGLPHYGHLLTGFIKDLIPRYKTMRGYRVERRFGWDCHGLPAEMESEKELGVSGREAITKFGIDNFNEHCRRSVLKYTKEWQKFVNRQARWVDFANEYKTLDTNFMESVIWAFKELYKKGLIYEGYKVVPYSWACQTPLSNFETRQDNSYRSRQDPAVTVKFKLLDTENTYLLIWTTTPWTLPSNLAVAVGGEIKYSEIESGGERYIIAKDALERYKKELNSPVAISECTGSDLLGRKYEPPFEYFKHKESENCFRVLLGDFVNTEDGTGIVHLAPGFGEDDQKLCDENQITLVCPVDEAGCFTSEVTDYIGVQVFDANKDIIKRLKADSKVIKHETYEHNYPHCWRTDTPLIYKAVSSWYVAVTTFKDRMSELNQEINWIPNHIRDGQFGKWLKNARDWSISRSRFWGTPIPIWQSDDPNYPRIDVYGSIAELERDFGVKVEDLHRPFIDTLTRPNPNDPSGQSKMRRVTDVLDCWFESGSMPFAQVHYPFENQEWFEKNFPADFIVEYIAQTRGWFSTLIVLSTALFDRPPFKNCLCHGVVLDENGKKLSKRLKNYPSPDEVYEKYGADALRWYFCSSSIVKGGDILIDREGRAIGDSARNVLNPIWNAYYFFTLYANSDKIKAEEIHEASTVLDRYILSKLHKLISEVESELDLYQLNGACNAIIDFTQALNNWYIRRSRERFWRSNSNNTNNSDKINAYNTLYTCLVNLVKVTAPILPLVSEEIFKNLTGRESIHLEAWPNKDIFSYDELLVTKMDRVREVCSIALSLRETHNLRTRLPLAELKVAGRSADLLLGDFVDILKEELNVKQIVLAYDYSDCATQTVTVNSRVLGPRLGKKTQEVINLAKDGSFQINEEGEVVVGEFILKAEEYSLTLKPYDSHAAALTADHSLLVLIDTRVNDDLVNEGYARDLIRIVQQARKSAELHVADRIELYLELPRMLVLKLLNFKDYIAEQTLAKKISITPLEEHGNSDLLNSDFFTESFEVVKGEKCNLHLRRIVL